MNHRRLLGHARMLALSLLSAAWMIGISAPASAQNQFFDQVYQRLYEAAVALVGYADFSFSHEVQTGRLYGDQTARYRLMFDEGQTYAIVAVCDDDCFDIDLHLYDSDGRLVDYDERLDAQAIVGVVPAYRDRFTAVVSIPHCRAYRCTYGVGFFVH